MMSICRRMVAARVWMEAVPVVADIGSLLMQGLSNRTVDVFFPLDCVGACGRAGNSVYMDLEPGGLLRRDGAGLVEQYGAFSVLQYTEAGLGCTSSCS